MFKKILTIFCFVAATFIAVAQPPSREDLEKQRAELKKEKDLIEKLMQENASKTKGTFVEWKMANDKVNLQDKVIDNINRDIYLLDNNLYSIQRDINKYDRLLDTLKQEYAKSMVYAYRNRNNYDFLNFIFSAKSFNDAIKRIAYLKSYRNYRQMQGENIIRTQELRRNRIEELTGVKQKKTVVLVDKSKEMDALEKQKLEKDRILAELKKKGKQYTNQLAAINKKFKNLNTLAEKVRKAAIAKAEADRLAAIKSSKPVSTPATKPTNVTVTKVAVAKKEGIFNTEENLALNARLENNRGGLPWPVDKGYVLMHFGQNQLPSGSIVDNPGLTIATDIGMSVKAVFDGTVTMVINDDVQTVSIQHGRYFALYSNLSGVNVQTGQSIKTGQSIGRTAANMDGIGALEFMMSNEKNNLDPAKWLKRR